MAAAIPAGWLVTKTMSGIDTRLPVHLVVNPHSGYGGSLSLLSGLRTEMHRAGLKVTEYTTKGPEDATLYVRQLPGKCSAVIVWGGDGTVNEVTSGLVGTAVPVMPCHAGTENLLAKELRIPRDPRKLLQVLLGGDIVECDVGKVNDCNFLLIVGVGFDGEVVRRLSSSRSGHISHLSYFWPMWRTFWEHNFPRMRIVADEQEIFDDFGLAFIGNISRYAVGLRICRDALFDDGLLDLVVFSCKEQTALMLHAGWTLLRRHPLKGNVLYRQVQHVRIETDKPAPSQVDGDIGPSTPLEISLATGRVKIIVPPRPSPWHSWPWTGVKHR